MPPISMRSAWCPSRRTMTNATPPPAPTIQSPALSAILFLYQQVLRQDIGRIDEVVRAKQPHRVPVVLTQDEVTAGLRHLTGSTRIMGPLLYGAGLRLMECLRLRVKDVDFSYNQIVVRDGQGHQDRVTMLPHHVKAPLQHHLHDVHTLHAQELQVGLAMCTCRMPWSGNIPMPIASGAGNRSFLPRSRRKTHGRAASGGITSTNWSYSGRCRRQSGRQGFPSRRAVRRCATPLRPLCAKQGTTSGPYRTYSGTKTSGRL